MRAQDPEGEKQDNIKRVLSILEIDFLGIAPAGFLDQWIPKVKKRLTSPESATLLADLWDIEYTKGKCDDVMDRHQEHAFGAVLKRKSENITDGSIYSQMVDLYLKADIKKWFGLTIIEWFDLNMLERDMLIKHSKAAMERASKAFEEVSNTTEEARKNLKKSAESITDMDTLLGE